MFEPIGHPAVVREDVGIEREPLALPAGVP